MNRRRFLAALLALPFVPAAARLLPKKVREVSGLEQALIDAAAMVQRNAGEPQTVFVNEESWQRLSHMMEHGMDVRRDNCARCVQLDTAALKRRLLAKWRPERVQHDPFPSFGGIHSTTWRA